MSNSKISALTSATTPLAGTETLPVVQSSTTEQVSVANLTAGRTPSMSGALIGAAASAVSGYNLVNSGNAYFGGTPIATSGALLTFRDGSATGSNTTLGGVQFTSSPGNDYFVGKRSINANGFLDIGNANSGATYFRVDNTGNMAVQTAAKGINFTANTPATGMTSQLLNWYEEGTWTPNQGGGLTVIGAFSSTGKYTRNGRNVTISGTVTGATSVAVAAAGIITTNLPFTVGTAGHGNVTNAALTSFAAIICTSTNVTSSGAIAATGTLTFSATYFV